MKITREEIEKEKTIKGGWTKGTLAKWGVPWPPPRGWKKALIKDAERDSKGLSE
jgi:hypothetical protein